MRQDPTLGVSETFNSFLRKAQQVRRELLGAHVGCAGCPAWGGSWHCPRTGGRGGWGQAANPLSLQETQQIPTEEVVLEVLLSNGQKVKVTILTSDQTEDVLEVREILCWAGPAHPAESRDFAHLQEESPQPSRP